MNKEKAVHRFLEEFRQLRRLPLISDAEMARLFGDEIAAGMAELDRYNRARGICYECADHCCRLVSCEFYVSGLKVCPLQHFRPALCRAHYCTRFVREDSPLVKELGDIFLDSVLAAEIIDKEKAALMDCPPFVPRAPRLVSAIMPLINRLKESVLEPSLILDLIRQEAEEYQTGS